MLNVNLLKAEFAKNGMTATEVANEIGMTKALMSRKLHGFTEFKCSEIQALIDVLHIEDVRPIFFAD